MCVQNLRISQIATAEAMNFDQFMKIIDSDPEFRETITDDYMRVIYRVHERSVTFRGLSDMSTQLFQMQLVVTHYETGLRLLKHYGHVVRRVSFETDTYTEAQAAKIGQFINKYCADSVLELDLAGDKVIPVISERVHFRSLQDLRVQVRDHSNEFTVGYTSDELINFEIDVVVPGQLPVEVLRQHPKLRTVSMPSTEPGDASAYLRHLSDSSSLQEVRLMFGVTSAHKENDLGRLLDELDGLRTIHGTVFTSNDDLDNVRGFVETVEAKWGYRTEVSDLAHNEIQRIIIRRFWTDLMVEHLGENYSQLNKEITYVCVISCGAYLNMYTRRHLITIF